MQVLADSYRRALTSTVLVHSCAAIPLNDLRRDRITILDLTDQLQGVAEAVMLAGLVKDRTICSCLHTLILRNNDIAAVRAGHPSPKSKHEAEHRRKVVQRQRRLLQQDPENYRPPQFFDAHGIDALCAACRTNPNIKVMDLRGNSLGAEGAKALIKALHRNTSLELLSEVPIKRLRQAGGLLAAKSKKLAAQWCCKCDNTLAVAAAGLVQQVTGYSPEAAARARHQKAMQKMAMRRTAMKSSAGWMDELVLVNKELGDCEVHVIAHFIKPLELRNVDLRGNCFGIKGAEALLKALARKQSALDRNLQAGNIFVTRSKSDLKNKQAATLAHNHALEELCGIPVVQLRANAIRTLDLSHVKQGHELGVGGAVLLAAVLKFTGSAIMNLNVSNNGLGGRLHVRKDLGGLSSAGLLILGKVLAKWPWKDTLKSATIRCNNVDKETKDHLVMRIGDMIRL